jgi:hypothetical protein
MQLLFVHEENAMTRRVFWGGVAPFIFFAQFFLSGKKGHLNGLIFSFFRHE